LREKRALASFTTERYSVLILRVSRKLDHVP
jgi:hypothetical protein